MRPAAEPAELESEKATGWLEESAKWLGKSTECPTQSEDRLAERKLWPGDPRDRLAMERWRGWPVSRCQGRGPSRWRSTRPVKD